MNEGFQKGLLFKKLTKLNTQQQSIDDLSKWCVIHHCHRKQVVEAWDCEFFVAAWEKRVSFLYLANHIMQNARKEGYDGYITEFMRVIPAALNKVFANGGDFEKMVVKRLVDVWEDRKIFENQEQSVKDKFSRELKVLLKKLEKPLELMEKVVSSYKDVLNAAKDENRFLLKCKTSLDIFDNINKQYENNSSSGSTNGSRFAEEVNQQHSNIRKSIEKLKKSESRRATLISYLKEALKEQELKVAQVRNQLEAAEPRYKRASELRQKLRIVVEGHEPSNQGHKRPRFSEMPATRAANEVTKFPASVASKEMATNDLSSQTNMKNVSQEIEHHSSHHKRQKIEDNTYMSQAHLQQPPPPPPFPHPHTIEPPPPPPPEYPASSPPPPPPPPPIMIPPPPPEYPQSPLPPPPPTSVPPIMIPPPTVASTPHQRISHISPVAGPFVPFPVRPPRPRMPHGIFPLCTPAVNFPMTNMPRSFPGAPNPPPAFQGSRGTFYGISSYPTAPPWSWKY